MRLKELIELMEHYNVDPNDTIVAVTSEKRGYEQDWNITADIHPAKDSGDVNVLVIYMNEEVS